MKASALAAAEWMRRVEAEYTSAAITQHLVLWLLRLGAPPELIREGLRIVDDELVHAELSHAVATAAGATSRPALAQEQLGLVRTPQLPLAADVARHGVEVFCLGETVAVPLFVAMRAGCTVAPAREALDRIVLDEVRHRDFGWTLLSWLLDTHGAAMREEVQARLGGMLARQRRSYAPSGAATADGPALPAVDAAWGLLPPRQYAEILARCIERDYRPRLSQLGFDLDAALSAAAAD